MAGNGAVSVNVRLPQELRDEAAEVAEAEGKTFSELFRAAVVMYVLARKGRAPDKAEEAEAKEAKEAKQAPAPPPRPAEPPFLGLELEAIVRREISALAVLLLAEGGRPAAEAARVAREALESGRIQREMGRAAR